MASKKESGKDIIKPLAAAFLTTEPKEDSMLESKPVVKKAAPPRSASRNSDMKTADLAKLTKLTQEETRAMLKEQLLTDNKAAEMDLKKVLSAASEDKADKEIEKEVQEEVKKEAEKPVSKAKTDVSAVKKEAEKKVPEQKASDKKVSEKKSTDKKAAPKKAEDKKAAVSKAEEPKAEPAPKADDVQEFLTIEYSGVSYSREELIARALKLWTSKMKRSRAELHSIELYVKPQEKTVYYVFNGKRKGSFEL